MNSPGAKEARINPPNNRVGHCLTALDVFDEYSSVRRSPIDYALRPFNKVLLLSGGEERGLESETVEPKDRPRHIPPLFPNSFPPVDPLYIVVSCLTPGSGHRISWENCQVILSEKTKEDVALLSRKYHTATSFATRNLRNCVLLLGGEFGVNTNLSNDDLHPVVVNINFEKQEQNRGASATLYPLLCVGQAPAARAGHSVEKLPVVDGKNTFIMFGGTDGKAFFDDLWSLTGEEGCQKAQWLRLNRSPCISPFSLVWPCGRAYHASVSVRNTATNKHEIIIYGGCYVNEKTTETQEEQQNEERFFVLSFNNSKTHVTWRILPVYVKNVGQPRRGHSMEVIGDNILVLGGLDYTKPHPYGTRASLPTVVYDLSKKNVRFVDHELLRHDHRSWTVGGVVGIWGGRTSDPSFPLFSSSVVLKDFINHLSVPVKMILSKQRFFANMMAAQITKKSAYESVEMSESKLSSEPTLPVEILNMPSQTTEEGSSVHCVDVPPQKPKRGTAQKALESFKLLPEKPEVVKEKQAPYEKK